MIAPVSSFATVLSLLTAAVDARATILTRADCTFATAAAAIAGKTKCSTIILNNIVVPAGTTLDLTGLATGTTVTFSGTTSFGYKEWDGPLISISGQRITINGTPTHLIDGGGARWWDGLGSNMGGKTKPKLFNAHSLIHSTITGLKVKNTPVQAFSINSVQDLGVYDVHVDNSAGDNAGGHNTDGFDIGSSTGVVISGAVVHNQDDCLAINSGVNITFTGGACSGGHGLSIGSVGGRSDNTVKTVRIENSSISNSQNGVRVKTVYGATGSVSDVTYSGITLSGITKYGIVIEQDYENGTPRGIPTAGVPITGLTVSGVTGSVTSDAIDIYILCAKGACSGWTWSGNKITGGTKSLSCSNVPSPASC